MEVDDSINRRNPTVVSPVTPPPPRRSTKSAGEFVNLTEDDGDYNGGGAVVLLTSTPESSHADGTTQMNAISVEDYNLRRRPIMASLASEPSCSCVKKDFIDLCGETLGGPSAMIDLSSDDEIQILDETPNCKCLRTGNSNSKPLYIYDCDDDEQSAAPPTFLCEICCDVKETSEIFRIMVCNHLFCSDCISKFVASKIQDNILLINCPVSGCKGVLEPYHCRSILPQQVFDRWGDALCEALVLASEKFYCPYKDCSALLINEKHDVVQSECPECRRLFCAKCMVPWHSDISCSKFQKLHEDEREREDIQLMNFANHKQWRRCPNCRVYVERISGCPFMKCRCKCTFCYKCGARTVHDHYCSSCGT